MASGGGDVFLAIGTTSPLQNYRRDNLFHRDDEKMWVKINLNPYRYVCSFYRPPNTSVDTDSLHIAVCYISPSHLQQSFKSFSVKE